MSKANPKYLDNSLKREEEYWSNKLTGELSVASLPLDFRRPESVSHIRAVSTFELDAATGDRISTICGGNERLVFSVLISMLKICLHCYSRSEDIIVGTPIHDRYKEIASLNRVLALRDRVSKDTTVRQLLSDVKLTLSEAYSHQKLSFDRVLEILKIGRPRDREPIFSVVVALDNEISRENIRHLKNDLTLLFSVSEERIAVSVEYDPALFRADTIEAFAANYERVAQVALNAPDARISDLKLLSGEHRECLIYGLNRTESAYPGDLCIHQLFEAQAARTPDATAVICGRARMSYAQLHRKSNRLARLLRELGVGPEALVGICVERSINMIVGLLGVLKAGGAYLPLDPTYPSQRLAYMLEDSQAKVLLVEQKTAGLIPDNDATALCLDSDWENAARYTSEDLECAAVADNLAYVIYTSGSTGTPKGICIPHRAVNRLVLNTDYVDLSGEDRVAQASNFSFDAATFEIWGALLNGATLIEIGKDVAITPSEFASAVRDDAISVVFLTTALFNQIAREAPGAFNGMKHVLFGGEAVDPRWVKEVLDSGGPQRLLHVYGPTENTTFSSWELVEEVAESAQTVPIGKPISNTRIHILDERLEPAPLGIPGELWVGGEGLARCYLNRPELTAERFIPDRFSRRGGERLYKTGDVARYLPGGSVEFLGRKDEQVKIRGFRIEPGEIEAMMRQHEGVKDGVIVVREEDGERRLSGYWSPVLDKATTTHDLRRYLKERLPEYMVPASLMMIDEMPLTPNGKVDRRALPAPQQVRPELETGYVEGRTPLEQELAAIWTSVLTIDRAGIYDNFFELGGHSLLATEAVSRIRQAFQVEIPLRALFEMPTVAELAEYLDGEITRSQSQHVSSITRTPDEGPLPLSFAQQRLWFLYQLDPGNAAYNIPSSVYLSGSLNVAALREALNEVVRRHEALRTTFAAARPEPVQVIRAASPAPFWIIDLTELRNATLTDEVQRLSTEETGKSFDLTHGPVLRTTLLRLGPGEFVLLLTMHHIASDGWSMSLFITELVQLYEAYSEGKGSPLEELRIQYKDFARWQRKWMKGEVLEKQLDYWRRQLKGIDDNEGLPTDYPRSAERSHAGARVKRVVSKQVTQRLKEMGRERGVTLFMTLLAAFEVVMKHYGGREEVVVGTDVANRNRGETEGLIGFFVNQLVMRMEVKGEWNFEELLSRVREVALEGYANQDVPFEKVVEAINPRRAGGQSPFFQVKMVLQNAPRHSPEVKGVRVKVIEVQNRTAKFDILLSLFENDDGLLCSYQYDTSLFERDTITRLADQFEIVLREVISLPASPLCQLIERLKERDKQDAIDKRTRSKNAQRQKLKGLTSKSAAGVQFKERETV